ncbi:MAG: hypothetical protein Q9217_003454 [Psora testacea]
MASMQYQQYGSLIAVFLGVCLHVGYFQRGEHHMYGLRYLQAFTLLFMTSTAALTLGCELPLFTSVKITGAIFGYLSIGIYGSLLFYRIFWHPLRRFPGPTAAKITSLWYSTQVTGFDAHKKALELYKKYGPFVRVGSSDLMIAHPLAVPAVHGAQSKCRKASWYDEDWPRQSIHTSRDHRFHADRRRVWSQSFSDKALRGYESRIAEYNQALMDRLGEHGGHPVNAAKWFSYYGYDVMGCLAFNKDFGMLRSGEQHFAVELLDEALGVQGLKLPTWTFRMLIAIPGLTKQYWRFIQYCDEQLALKIASDEKEKGWSDKPSLIASLLTHSGLRPTRQDLLTLQSDSRTVIIAGSDTIAASLSHVFYLLAAHPSHVAKLRQELSPHINPDNSFTHNKIFKLDHLNAVINEALRLYPVPPTAIVRKTPPEGILVDGTHVPGNMNVWTPQYVIARSDIAYEQAYEFVPERWYERTEMVKESAGLVIADAVSRYEIEFPRGKDGSEFIENAKDQFTWGLTELNLCFPEAIDPSPIGATINEGVTEIFGNSFGQPGFNATYDYIIVGGGNAGNTIAARLALDPANYSVALVEAGSFYEITDGNRTQVPGYNWINTLDFPIGQVSTPVSIALNTTPQAAYADRRLFYLAAQTFGGGPTVGSLDKWSTQVDDDYWTWDNVYPAFKKSVTFQPPDYTKINPSNNITFDPSAFSSDGGPLHVSYGNYFGPSGPALATAMDRTGLKPIAGLNSGKLIGYSTMTATVDTRTVTRDSSETSFLQAGVRGSGNLKIYPNALVQRVTFDGQKKATGVDVKVNLANVDLNYHLTATKEVILSAGVWHSPQILMVSGVGPAETLQRYGINVVSDLPGVGQNEWDQPLVPLVYAVNTTTNTQFQAGNPQVVSTAISDYLNRQSGILTGVGTGLAVGFEKFPDRHRRQFKNSTLTHLSTFPTDWPEVEYVELENIPITIFESILGSIGPTENYFNINGVLLATQSRGNMTINSADITTQPSISPNWLANGDVDMDQALAAFHRVREIASNCSVIAAEVFPGPTVNTTEAIKTFLRRYMNHLFHGSGTCKMGTSSDPSSVVDSRARVHGVTGLRVVDASAFPLLPPGHPMASVYMFAEKIAESILSGE